MLIGALPAALSALCPNLGLSALCPIWGFRYANDLGIRAKAGFAQYQRQDLLGGRYGLLSIPGDDQRLGPTDPVGIQPDFWINFM